MANNDIIVSEMTSATQINTGDLMIMTQPDAQAETGYSTKSGTVLQVSNKMLKGTNYETDLPSFTNKNVLGGMEELKGDIFNLLPVDEASGAIANFETALALPLVSGLVNIEATGGNGTPDNPNPINGYSSANIVNTQNESIVDLFSIDSDFRGTVAFNQVLDVDSLSDNVQWDSESIQSNGNNKYTITFSGNETSRFWFRIINNKDFDIVDGHKYLFITNFKMSNGSFSNARTSIRFSYGNTTVETIQTGTPGIGDYILAATTTGKVDRIQIYNIGDSSITSSTIMTIQPILFDLTAMFGSTIADYIYSLEQATAGAGVAFFRNIYPEDYYAYDSGTTEIVGKETPEATIAFGQTVYGGVLDVTRGKLTVTHANIASYNGESINEPWLSSMDTYVPNTTPTTGAQVVYPLTTPFDIDLTPEVISAIVGENNVFADCGNVDVKFKDTIQHYIDKKIAQTQALIL